LLYVADQLNQIKQYSYTLDDKPSAITYYNSVNPTPNVGFTYDPYFPRLTSMTDGSGTTQYQYYNLGVLGALQLAQETPPFANATIAYSYDQVGRLAARSVGGDMEQFGYDSLNRLTTHVDDLGSFTRTYLGETTQLTGQSNGTVGTAWSYYPNLQDRRLMSVATTGGTTYGLTWTDENDLTGLTDSTNNLSWTYGYDLADRLTAATPSSGSGYAYTYDHASNLGPIQRPQGTTTITSNSVNQVTAVNRVASVYDANGNLLQDYARTYAWDADNRLIGVGIIGQAGMQTNFKYDGLGRRIAIDTTSGGVTSETRYQWCGETLCQARSSSDTASRRYLAEGENAIALSQSFYYGIDQLGSVRDALTVPSGGVAAHYDYDPYGSQSNTALATTDFKYGGLFYNSQTGLYLATHRAYDSLTARWISRDPIGESGGLNAYRYANSNATSLTDPDGKCPLCILVVGGAVAGAGLDFLYQLHKYHGDIGCVDFNQVAAAGGAGALAGLGVGLGYVGLVGEGAAEEAAAIQTPYALEAQSASAEAQAALGEVQNGATLYRTGTLGSNMTGESQYWSLENPLTSPGYASQMGVPGGTPNFVLSGTLNPEASVITNEAAALGSNAGGGIQIVTSPGGVGNLTFTMPYP
jgi:RHS repeat-associated protein